MINVMCFKIGNGATFEFGGFQNDFEECLSIYCVYFEENSTFDQQTESPLGLKDQQVLDVKSYARLFSKSIETLRAQLAEKGDGAELIWDKVSSANAWGCILHMEPWPGCWIVAQPS